MLLSLAFVVPLFAVIATAFIPFGQLIGWYLEPPAGVKAYSVNVVASLAGIAGFTLLCFLHQPPWVWFFIAVILSVIAFWRNAAARTVLGVTSSAVCLFSRHPRQPLFDYLLVALSEAFASTCVSGWAA